MNTKDTRRLKKHEQTTSRFELWPETDQRCNKQVWGNAGISGVNGMHSCNCQKRQMQQLGFTSAQHRFLGKRRKVYGAIKGIRSQNGKDLVADGVQGSGKRNPLVGKLNVWRMLKIALTIYTSKAERQLIGGTLQQLLVYQSCYRLDFILPPPI